MTVRGEATAEREARLTVGAVVVLLALGALLTGRAAWEVRQSTDAILEVRESEHDMGQAARDAILAGEHVRMFVATGEEAELERSAEMMQGAQDHLARARSRAPDADARRLLERVAEALDDRIVGLEHRVALRRESFEAASEPAVIASMSALSQAFQEAVEDASNELDARLRERVVAWRASAAGLGVLAAFLVVLSGVLALLGLARVRAAEQARMLATSELERSHAGLEEALRTVKQLSGLLPICAGCKNIRDDEQRWVPVEAYVRDRTDAEFTHGICPECRTKIYGL